MNLLKNWFARRRTYSNYWGHRLGSTVRVTRGAFCGRSGRLTTLCSETFGLVAFTAEQPDPPAILYADMQVETG